MTTSTAAPAKERHGEPASAVGVGHPVRNFVAVLILLAASLGALWWTGAVTPRLEIVPLSVVDVCGQPTSVSFRLKNPTPFAVSVRTVRVTPSDFRVNAVTMRAARRAGRSVDTPLRPFRLGAGEARIVTAIGGVPAGGWFSFGSTHVTVTARTPLGITRTVAPRGASSFAESTRGMCPG